ncbi:hypothetical protein [Streptomyces blattellae]|uniref:hypothetical protein n=1 Tax=Streptomyces blattellae TaxID=2569855 RepID=UPI0012B88A63|nr:hypothetical protein [Streptomyces blattellae]
MSAQPEHGWGAMPLPQIRTVDDLRSALSRYGFPGDRERFEEELAAAIGAAPTNDFAGRRGRGPGLPAQGADQELARDHGGSRRRARRR